MAPSFRDLVCNDLKLCEQAEFAQAAWTAEKTGAGIDRILVQAGHITQVQARDALCRYLDVAGISLADWIPDAALCAQAGYRRCLAFGFIPWQRLGNSVVLAVHDAERMIQIVAEAKLIWPDHRIGLILATPDDVTTAIATAFGPQISADALTTCPARYSCRNWGQVLSPTVIVAAMTALLLGAIASPTLAITILLVWILIANSATLGLRLTAIFTFRWTGMSKRHEMIQPPVWPTISLLLPVVLHMQIAVLKMFKTHWCLNSFESAPNGGGRRHWGTGLVDVHFDTESFAIRGRGRGDVRPRPISLRFIPDELYILLPTLCHWWIMDVIAMHMYTDWA
jgi:hypothetical protein